MKLIKSFLALLIPFALTGTGLSLGNKYLNNNTSEVFAGNITHSFTTGLKSYETFMQLDSGSSLITKYNNYLARPLRFDASADYNGDGVVDRMRIGSLDMLRVEATPKQLELFEKEDIHLKELKETYSH